MKSLGSLLAIYFRHARGHPWRTLLTVVGIAVGVAMVFVVQVASRSVGDAFDEVRQGIGGSANYELESLGPRGMPAATVRRVDRVGGTTVAPVLDMRATVAFNGRSMPVLFAGGDSRMYRISSNFVRKLRLRPAPGAYLPEPIASKLNVKPGQIVTVRVRGRAIPMPVAAILMESTLGSIVHRQLVATSLPFAQAVTGLGRRISRIFVSVSAAADNPRTLGAIARAGGPGTRVLSARDTDRLLDNADRPGRQSLRLLGAITLLIGLVLAFNAMLVAAVERRRQFAQLRVIGASDATLVLSMVVEALVIGLAASLVGVAVGYALSNPVLRGTSPTHAAAFQIEIGPSVTAGMVGISVAAGIATALLATIVPARTLMRVSGDYAAKSEARITQQPDDIKPPFSTLVAGLVLVAGSVAALIDRPQHGVIGAFTFTLGMALLVPHLVGPLVAAGERLADRLGGAVFSLSMAELAVSPRRTAALAAICAWSVAAVVTAAGINRSLDRELRQGATDLVQAADIWVLDSGRNNEYVTRPFNRSVMDRVERVPEVAGTRPVRAAFLDWGERRLWAIGWPLGATKPIAESQLVDGTMDAVRRRFREGGWATLSWTVARNKGIRIGERFAMPTPSGVRHYRLAATITDYGWPSGAVVMGGPDFRRAWRMGDLTAIQADLNDGVSPADGRRAVDAALGNTPALSVKTAAQVERQAHDLARKSLGRVALISNVLLVGALFGVITAMLTALAYRIPRVASLRAIGMTTGQTYGALFAEVGALLLVGSVIGLAFGLPLQAVLGRWYSATTGQPVHFAVEAAQLAKVVIAALAASLLGAIVATRLLLGSTSGRSLSPE